MPDSHDAVILELAPLPREQIGPFLLLGVSKNADQEEIEASWAHRVIWARKKQLRIPLEDVNWARETINSPERRVKADITSLNADTVDGVLQRLSFQLGGKNARLAAWQPLDHEKSLGDYAPAMELPDSREIRDGIAIPEAPQEMPLILSVLQELAREPLDPWSLTISCEPNRGAAE
jgi:hypothetical protein